MVHPQSPIPNVDSQHCPVRKKNGQLRVCMDFRVLNSTYPKDDFPLPITEIMVDVTTGHETLSFMDGSSGYNQIRMALANEKMTAFRTPKGYIATRPIISGRLAKWAIMLQQYDIIYVPQKAIKGQVLADFLADHLIPLDWKLSEDLPDVKFSSQKSRGWAKAIALREAKKENVVDFIRTHIIYQYGIPHRIVTDNGRQFSNTLMDRLCEKFKFKQYKSSRYNNAANGLAEAFKKILCNLLKKIISKSKRDWQEKIGEALWACHTIHRTPTRITP
ncbi:uncharacterized protein LOC120077228 [Benincasa hispida]|uniref:uncharacterized protein LOC120077228 n=1 Tax=Benincasa hispida TaxID=102211 RepID=UPI0018FF6EF4|nr:uncharacterized protein LOC120077228 [Benincasa hispida]